MFAGESLEWDVVLDVNFKVWYASP